MPARKTESDRALSAVIARVKDRPGEMNLTLLQEYFRGKFSLAAVARAVSVALEEGTIRREGAKKGTRYFPA